MKNYILILLLLIYYSSLFGQKKTETIDTTTIEFKAKLLTISRFGLADKKTVLENILNQEVTYLETGITDVFILKIQFSQRYYRGDTSSYTPMFGYCYNYIAYHTKLNKYYRLGGFLDNDAVDFFSDLERLNIIHTVLSTTNDQYLDILCLYVKYTTKNKKRKNKLDCDLNCDNTIGTTPPSYKEKNE